MSSQKLSNIENKYDFDRKSPLGKEQALLNVVYLFYDTLYDFCKVLATPDLLHCAGQIFLHSGGQSAGSQFAGSQLAGLQSAGLQSAGLQFAGAQFAGLLSDAFEYTYTGLRPNCAKTASGRCLFMSVAAMAVFPDGWHFAGDSALAATLALAQWTLAALQLDLLTLATAS